MYHLPFLRIEIKERKNPHYAVVGCFEPANAGGYPPEYFTFPLIGGLCAIIRVQIPYVIMLAQNYTDNHVHSRAAPLLCFYDITVVFLFQLIQFTITAPDRCFSLIILNRYPKNAAIPSTIGYPVRKAFPPVWPCQNLLWIRRLWQSLALPLCLSP